MFLSNTPVPDDVEEDSEDFDLLKGGAKWIACEVREFLSGEHLQFYIDQLQEQIDLDENSPLLRAMSRNYPASNGHMTLRNTLIGMTNVLRKGIKDED